jgi:hypothetical protein
MYRPTARCDKELSPNQSPKTKNSVEIFRAQKKDPRFRLGLITEFEAVDRIIDHMKLPFVAAKPPPSHVFEQVALAAAEESGEYS